MPYLWRLSRYIPKCISIPLDSAALFSQQETADTLRPWEYLIVKRRHVSVETVLASIDLGGSALGQVATSIIVGAEADAES